MSDAPTNSIDRAIGAKLAGHRQAAGLTQTALAAQAGIPLLELISHEDGTLRMGAKRLFAVCVALDLRPIDLLDGVGERSERPQSPRDLNDDSPHFT